MELTQAYTNYYQQVNVELTINSILMVELKNTEKSTFIPAKKYPSDAGYDCRARIEEPIGIEPGHRVCVPLGFGVNIPLNHTGDLRPRSGMTRDSGIMVGYGTIDAGYTGEVTATIFNFGQEVFVIHPEDRIAQLVILPTMSSGNSTRTVELVQVEHLIQLERGENGHGSSGTK